MSSVAFTYDIHLSAMAIAPDTVVRVESEGFAEDRFVNNRRCLASRYHATYRGERDLPCDSLWSTVCGLLQADDSFIGSLEEESIDPSFVVQLRGEGDVMPPVPSAPALRDCGSGMHKACDIHLSVEIEGSDSAAVEHVDDLQLISFDKPVGDKTRRVHSITCDSVEDGRRVFQHLVKHMTCVPGLVGKIKMEKTTRFLRVPSDAPTLPITTAAEVARWLKTFPSVG